MLALFENEICIYLVHLLHYPYLSLIIFNTKLVSLKQTVLYCIAFVV